MGLPQAPRRPSGNSPHTLFESGRGPADERRPVPVAVAVAVYAHKHTERHPSRHTAHAHQPDSAPPVRLRTAKAEVGFAELARRRLYGAGSRVPLIDSASPMRYVLNSAGDVLKSKRLRRTVRVRVRVGLAQACQGSQRCAQACQGSQRCAQACQGSHQWKDLHAAVKAGSQQRGGRAAELRHTK